MTQPEATVIRRYLKKLSELDRTVSDGVEGGKQLHNDWRRRLCGFVGVAPGPLIST